MAIIEGARAPQRPRNRWVAWLTGSDIEDATAPVASPEALAPPPPEVRREILRLEMEAELAQLSAEVEALASDEAIAAQDQGDSVRAKAAVAAVLGTEATTEAIKEAAEEAAAEEIAAKEARDAEPRPTRPRPTPDMPAARRRRPTPPRPTPRRVLNA